MLFFNLIGGLVNESITGLMELSKEESMVLTLLL